VTIGGTLPAAGTATGSRADDGTVLADDVLVAPGCAALVRPMVSAGGGPSGEFLVTDLGRRYAIASDDALSSLGYAGLDPVPMPAALVQLIPAGPALDPATAGAPVGTAAQPAASPSG
jgi:hypothetical protein